MSRFIFMILIFAITTSYAFAQDDNTTYSENDEYVVEETVDNETFVDNESFADNESFVDNNSYMYDEFADDENFVDNETYIDESTLPLIRKNDDFHTFYAYASLDHAPLTYTENEHFSTSIGVSAMIGYQPFQYFAIEAGVRGTLFYFGETETNDEGDPIIRNNEDRMPDDFYGYDIKLAPLFQTALLTRGGTEFKPYIGPVLVYSILPEDQSGIGYGAKAGVKIESGWFMVDLGVDYTTRNLDWFTLTTLNFGIGIGVGF